MRAEELINTVFKKRVDLIASGRRPTAVILSNTNYTNLENYRRRLMPLPTGIPDYITQYTLFDLPIYIDNRHECEVKYE